MSVTVDWQASPVGPPSAWPQALRGALSIVSQSRFPMVVMWGPQLAMLYNASYAPMLGSKHPWAMGRPIEEVWPEIWETIRPMFDGVLRGDGATFSEDLLLPLTRNGFLEECYFTFSFSPIADGTEVGGIFCAVVETSRKVIAERRLRVLHALESRSLREVTAESHVDIPFSRLYLANGADFSLRESSGPPAAANEAWPIAEVAHARRAQVVESPIAATATLEAPLPVATAPVESAIVLPLAAAGTRNPLGALVVGLSPFSALDDAYRRFLELISARIAAEIAAAPVMENERALRTLSDVVPQIICTAGPDGNAEYFNRRWFEFTGLSEAETFEAEGWRNAIHPDDREAFEEAWRATAREGSDFATEARIRGRDKEYVWFLMRAVALRDVAGALVRLFCTATDIDERKRHEEREAFSAHVSDVLSSTLDARALLQKVTELCVPAFADWCQLQSLSSDDELTVEAVRHRDSKLHERLESLVGRSVVAMGGAVFGSPHVLRTEQSLVLDHAATVRGVAENVPDAGDRAIYEAAGLGTALIVPLVARGRTRGTLHLVNIDPASPRSGISVEIAEELARRAALAIDNSRLYEREHRVATALQHAMLPAKLPSHPKIELSYAYRPAERESRVGGDWYDAFGLSNGRMAISIGDVAGHGLEASVAMNEARQALRLSALEGLSPAQTLRRANAALMLDEEPPMITAIYGVIDPERSTFRYSCAGHPSPALAPFLGRARYLEGGGIPLGVERDAQFPSREVSLLPFSTLLLYTDGLIEFDRNLERESARLLDALNARVHDMSSDGAGALVRNVLNNRQIDDIAVLAATIFPLQPIPIEIKLPASPSSATIVRRFVSRYARVAQLGAERSFDLVIAVGEAVANAVEHAYRGGEGAFVLRLDYRGGEVIGEVEDVGTWREGRPNPERGRGLSILRAATRRFELHRGSGGTTVTFAL